jgi:Putative zinc dependent peptidase (DUF5700)
MIEKTNDFDESATTTRFISDLLVIAGEKTLDGKDPFNLVYTKTNFLKSAKMLVALEAHGSTIGQEVANRIALFSIPGGSLQANAHMILGGTSDGWTTNEGGKNQFYINLDFFGEDIEGVKALMSHELFHLVQRKEQKYDFDRQSGYLKPEEQLAFSILRALVNEGSANLVGDLLRWKNPRGEYITRFAEKISA